MSNVKYNGSGNGKNNKRVYTYKPCKCGENKSARFSFFMQNGRERRHPYCKKCRQALQKVKGVERRRERQRNAYHEKAKSHVTKGFRRETAEDYILLNDPDGTLRPGVFRVGADQMTSDVATGSYLRGTLFWHLGEFFFVNGRKLASGAEFVNQTQ